MMVEVLFYLAYQSVLDVYYLVGLVCHAALVRHHDYGYVLLGVEHLQQFHHLHARL